MFNVKRSSLIALTRDEIEALKKEAFDNGYKKALEDSEKRKEKTAKKKIKTESDTVEEYRAAVVEKDAE